MFSIRRWLYKPKRSDSSLLAQFYYADEELNMVAVELDSFDGRKDPERCTSLVNQLRICQDKVLNIIQHMIDEVFDGQRASRDFRVKFPDDVLQESLAGQLWFGAECLAAGSSIMNRETESLSMRPLARALTKNLDSLRCILRERCLRNINSYSDRIKEALLIFDKLFAEFELSYVSAMVPVKTMKEYDVMQEVTVLFSESIQRALRLGLLSQEMVDDCDPALMFTIPRLAIVCGLLVYPEGPLNPDQDPSSMSEMFRPFQRLLYKIRELLYSMNSEELYTLEKAMCSTEEPFPRPGPAPTLCKQADKLRKNSKSLDRLSLHHYYIETAGQNIVEGSILFHPPNSGSPVTPISEDEIFHIGHMSHSPSTITVIENPSESFEGSEHILNECNRKDSGMFSDTVESNDSINRSPAKSVNPLLESEEERLLERETTGATSDIQDRDWRCHDYDSDSACSDAYCYCSYVVNSLVDAAVTVSINRMDTTKRPTPLSRQHSWQYDVQFEIPRISVQRSSSSEAEPELLSNQAEVTSIHPTSANESDVFPSEDDLNLPTTNDVAYSKNATQSASTECDKPERHISVVKRSSSASQSKQKLSDENQKKVSKLVEHSLSDKSSAYQRNKSGSSSLSSSPFDRHRSKSSASYIEPDDLMSDCLDVRRIQRLRYTESLSSNCSSCKSGCCPGTECEWERASSESSETGSYSSECHDDDEIALAIQAAEIASRNEARSRFTSSGDLIHRLFVCISGVADQLQTNYASDLRNILKSVFDMNCSELPVAMDESDRADESSQLHTSRSHERNPSPDPREDNPVPPVWIADEVCANCTSCRAPFTLVRRRHHCRNCGKIFCSRCSSNAVPLPHYGHSKPVRVCIRCFMFHVTPFTVDE